MEPAAGNGKDADIIYGLHAVREALRSGSRPLLRLLLRSLALGREFHGKENDREQNCDRNHNPREDNNELERAGHREC